MNLKTKPYQKNVSEFISQMPRNKLVIVKNAIAGIEFLNTDLVIGLLFNEIIDNSKFSLKAKDIIAANINKIQNVNTHFGKYMAISNIGVLLEKEIQFDFKFFLDQYSQNQVLFLKWEGAIEDNKLYFLTKQNGLEIDISDLSHIII